MDQSARRNRPASVTNRKECDKAGDDPAAMRQRAAGLAPLGLSRPAAKDYVDGQATEV